MCPQFSDYESAVQFENMNALKAVVFHPWPRNQRRLNHFVPRGTKCLSGTREDKQIASLVYTPTTFNHSIPFQIQGADP
jgi:hypothetical protein